MQTEKQRNLIRAFAQAMNQMLYRDITKQQLIELCNRHKVSAEKVWEAIMSNDIDKAATILGVDPMELDEGCATQNNAVN